MSVQEFILKIIYSQVISLLIILIDKLNKLHSQVLLNNAYLLTLFCKEFSSHVLCNTNTRQPCRIHGAKDIKKYSFPYRCVDEWYGLDREIIDAGIIH